MKKAIYIIICLLWISCANETKHSKSEMIEDGFPEEASIDANENAPKGFNYETLAAQKLMDYFDLLRLEEAHPEFKADIQLQLKQLTEDTLRPDDHQNIETIRNIRQAEKAITLSDSVQQMKLYFDVVSHSNTSTDSILATITIKTVTLDNVAIPSYKLLFQKIPK